MCVKTFECKKNLFRRKTYKITKRVINSKFFYSKKFLKEKLILDNCLVFKMKRRWKFMGKFWKKTKTFPQKLKYEKENFPKFPNKTRKIKNTWVENNLETLEAKMMKKSMQNLLLEDLWRKTRKRRKIHQEFRIKIKFVKKWKSFCL